MVGAHHTLNGSHALTTPFQGWFAIRWLALATISLSIKFEVNLCTIRVRYDTVWYIYVRSKADKMASLIWRTAQKRKKGKTKNKNRAA